MLSSFPPSSFPDIWMMRCSRAPLPSADDDILLAAYPLHTENRNAIDASALQACGDLSKQLSSWSVEYTSRACRHHKAAHGF
jgi:hypothetical protein